jgi:hypothetical protein
MMKQKNWEQEDNVNAAVRGAALVFSASPRLGGKE